MPTKLVIAIVSAIALSSTVIAQDLPLPARLLNAKTARLVNTGTPDGMFNRFVTEVRALNRFELVADKSAADITMSFEYRSLGTAGNWATGRSSGISRLFLTITDNVDDEVLYSQMFNGGMTVKSIIRGHLQKLDARMKAAQ